MNAGSDITVHSSPGFQALCQRFQDATGLDILELGPARGKNIEFWSRYSSSIFIADLRANLPLPPLQPINEEEEKAYSESEWHIVLNLPAGRNFDIILAWDLLNYTDENALPGFVDYINRYCKPGTMLFTMIIDQRQMPENSSLFHIVDEEHLSYETVNSATVPCPRLQPRVLENTMRGFRTSDSFRLRHGIIEYLFSFVG